MAAASGRGPEPRLALTELRHADYVGLDYWSRFALPILWFYVALFGIFFCIDGVSLSFISLVVHG